MHNHIETQPEPRDKGAAIVHRRSLFWLLWIVQLYSALPGQWQGASWSCDPTLYNERCPTSGQRQVSISSSIKYRNAGLGEEESLRSEELKFVDKEVCHMSEKAA